MRAPRKGDLDRIGPFHPYLVFAAIVLVDLIGLLLIVAALAWIGDRIEDVIWPGGSEWVDF